MSKFKLGDKVIAIVDHSMGSFKKGDIFTVDGFTCCTNCGLPCIYIKENASIVGMRHRHCGAPRTSERVNYSERCFEKAISIADAIEYKLKVSIPELVELKELQNQ